MPVWGCLVTDCSLGAAKQQESPWVQELRFEAGTRVSSAWQGLAMAEAKQQALCIVTERI